MDHNLPLSAPERSKHFTGDAALEKLRHYISRAFDDDAVGGVYGYKWANGLNPAEHITDPNDPRIEGTNPHQDFTLIIVDSGNNVGDYWKYIYHPQLQAGLFCYES